MYIKKNTIWISWENHRRTQTLSEFMGIQLIIFTSQLPRLVKIPYLSIKTIIALIYRRPKVLIVQNPSAFLTILTISLKMFMKYLLIVDAHNAGVYPFEKNHNKYKKIFPLLHRWADRTIVTNELLASIVSSNGGRPVVLPDKLPNIEITGSKAKTINQFVVTFICSYASDEPYMEVIRASHLLPKDIHINITGNYNLLNRQQIQEAAKNVEFTGFLSEHEYIKLLYSSDIIMDLTTFNDCMVCGAYEGVSIGVPLILSNTPVNRAWFSKGVIYTDNNKYSIAAAIAEAKKKHVQLKFEISCLKGQIMNRWLEMYESFVSDLALV